MAAIPAGARLAQLGLLAADRYRLGVEAIGVGGFDRIDDSQGRLRARSNPARTRHTTPMHAAATVRMGISRIPSMMAPRIQPARDRVDFKMLLRIECGPLVALK